MYKRQRRYLEALSTYTRRRLTQAEHARVDEVLHVPAALALHQRPSVPGVRSTFGTMTELNNSLRLLFSRCARHVCPHCGARVEDVYKRQGMDGAFDHVLIVAADSVGDDDVGTQRQTNKQVNHKAGERHVGADGGHGKGSLVAREVADDDRGDEVDVYKRQMLQIEIFLGRPPVCLNL